MARVRLERIARKFDQIEAISNISFEVPSGEFWVLLGPSGCGKSTILRIIAGLESAQIGNLYFDERLMNQIPARNRDVAMVFQNYALYPHMSVADNLGFGLKMRGYQKSIVTKRVESVSQMLELTHLLERKPKQLSGGQQQRVALGRAIIRQPQVFLLDEPLSNLDAILRDKTRTQLKKLHRQVGITTIYVTHDRVEAMTLADRIVIIDRGKIQQIGTPKEVYLHPRNRMVATFLGNPPMNIIRVSYYNRQFWLDRERALNIPEHFKKLGFHSQNGQSWDLGIRPENITLVQNDFDKDNDTILVEVEVIEPLGKEILVTTTIVNSSININLILPQQWQGKTGDKIELKLDLSQLFIFEPTTGKKAI